MGALYFRYLRPLSAATGTMIHPNQLTRASLLAMDEAQLRKGVLAPLFEAMGFRGVDEYHGGSGEQGKDFVMWKEDELEERVYYAVVVLADRISGKVVGGRTTASKVFFQIQQSFGSEFRTLLTLKPQTADRCWVVTSKEIKKEARDAIANALGDLTRKLVRLIDGDELWGLIERHLKPRLLFSKIEDAHEILGSVSDHYHLVAHIGGPRKVFTLRPKYPGAEKDAPLYLTTKFQFPDTPAGRDAKQALVEHFRTGAPVEVRKEYIAHVEAPELLKSLLGEIEVLGLGPAGSGNTTLCDVMIEPVEGSPATIQGVELAVVQAGTEQVTLSNRHQDIPWKLTLVIDQPSLQCTIDIKSNLENASLKQQLEALRFQTAAASGGMLRFTHFHTGRTIFGGPIASGMWPKAGHALIVILESLLKIEQRTGAAFDLPSSFPQELIQDIILLAEIVSTGEVSSGGGTIKVSAGRELAEKMVRELKHRPDSGFYIKSFEDQHVELLGVDLNLGRRIVRAKGAYISPGEFRRLSRQLENPEVDSFLVKVTVPKNSRIISHFPKWLPPSRLTEVRPLIDSEE